MGLMARVRVPASVGLRALNRRTPARPKSSQQEQDDLQQDNRLDDRMDDRLDDQQDDRLQDDDLQDDREARDLEARRQDDREANDLLDALDRQGDRRLPPIRRLEPENSLNTLDPAYFEPPPSVDRQQGPDTLDALGSVEQDPSRSSTHHAPASDGGLSPRPAQGPDSLDAERATRAERLVQALSPDRQDDQALDGRQGPDSLDALDGLDAGSVDHDPASSRPDDAERANRDKWLKLQRVDIGTLQAVQAERATRLEQAQDAMARARRPTPRQRAQLFDAEQEAKRESVFAEAYRRSVAPKGLSPDYRRKLVDAMMDRRARIKASRQASRGRRQADAGVRDRPYGGLPKVVVYNDSPGPHAPRSPR